MPSKKMIEKMQLVNASRPTREKFYKTYKMNLGNPRKWNADYVNELTNALSAAKKREIENKSLMHPNLRNYLHTYPDEMIETFGRVYKTMHPRSRENLYSVGRKALENPSGYKEVYQAILGTNYFPPGVKQNIEDALVSKLSYGYQQAPTPQEKGYIKKKVNEQKQQRQEQQPTQQKKVEKKTEPTHIQQPEVKDVKPTKVSQTKGKKTKDATKVEVENKPKTKEKSKQKQKPQQTQTPTIPKKFENVEPIIEQPPVVKEYKPTKREITNIQKATEKFETKVPPKTIEQLNKRFQTVEFKETTASPIRQRKRGEGSTPWQQTTEGLSPEQKARGLTVKDLYYQRANNDLISQIKANKIKGVKYSRDYFYAETRELLEQLNPQESVIPGTKITGFTQYNPETKKYDLPWHPANMGPGRKEFQMRNPDTGELIDRITKNNVKKIYIDRVDDDHVEYQLLYEQREIKRDSKTGEIKSYGPWELYGKRKTYIDRLLKKELDKVEKGKVENVDQDPVIEDIKRPIEEDVFEPADEPVPPPIEDEPYEPADDVEEEVPDLIEEFEYKTEPEKKPFQLKMDESDPEMDLLKAIGKRAKKAKIGVENWFRCARIEFSANPGSYARLVDLATRVANIDSRMLFMPRIEIDYWYLKFGPGRCNELIRNLEEVSGLRAYAKTTEAENEKEPVSRVIMGYYTRTKAELYRVLKEHYSGSDLDREVERQLIAMGYEVGREKI